MTNAESRTDTVLMRLQDLSAKKKVTWGVVSYSEHLPVFRAPREGGLAPRKNGERGGGVQFGTTPVFRAPHEGGLGHGPRVHGPR